MNAKDRRKLSHDFERSLIDLSAKAQEISVACLLLAKEGGAECCDQLVYTLADQGTLDVSNIIAWFERFGALKWNNKKGRFVQNGSHGWDLDGSCMIGVLSGRSVDFDFVGKLGLLEENSDRLVCNVSSEKIKYEFNNSCFYQEIGPRGVPASKRRWGGYKLKIKRK